MAWYGPNDSPVWHGHTILCGPHRQWYSPTESVVHAHRQNGTAPVNVWYMPACHGPSGVSRPRVCLTESAWPAIMLFHGARPAHGTRHMAHGRRVGVDQEQTPHAAVDGGISVDSGRLMNVFTPIGAYLERRNKRETSHNLAPSHGR